MGKSLRQLETTASEVTLNACLGGYFTVMGVTLNRPSPVGYCSAMLVSK